MSKLSQDQCPICQSTNIIEWYPSNIDQSKLTFTYQFTPESQKTFRVMRCHNCTHVFCSPLPKNIYKNYEDVIDTEYLRHSKTRELSAHAVIKVIKNFAPSGKLLDVGCATGDFLIVAKNSGYSVEGLELSHWSSSVTRKKGLQVHRQTLKNLSKKYPNKYAIITLWGVIEHFESPREEMQYLNRLLKPGGILVLWTGDVDGLMSRLLGRRWWYWQGQHIQYFTHNSLNYLAKKTGFESVITERYPIAATYDQMENSLSRYKFQKFAALLLKPFFMMRSIWYLKLPGEMFWIGRKISEK